LAGSIKQEEPAACSLSSRLEEAGKIKPHTKVLLFTLLQKEAFVDS
jgi:hypothetical protein